MSVQSFTISRSKQQGLSLVELMVSIVIGLLILAGVVQVVFTSKRTFLSQEDMSFIQENARYALSVLGQDIRGAGYWGCSSALPKVGMVLDGLADDDATIVSSSTLYSDDDLDILGSVLAFEGYLGSESTVTMGGAAVAFPANADADRIWGEDQYSDEANLVHLPESFVVRYAGGQPLRVLNDDNDRSEITVEKNGNNIPQAGDLLVASSSDCRSVGIFAATGTNDVTEAGKEVLEIGYLDGGANCSNKIRPDDSLGSHDCTAEAAEGGAFYQPGDTVMRYIAHGYYIEESTTIPGQPALKRVVLGAGDGEGIASNVEEIAVGVEDMALLYGVANVDGGIQFKTAAEVAAANQWPLLRSVQLSLVFRSQTQSQGDIDERAFIGGNVYNDRYLRQVVTTTFNLRNRI